VIDQYVDLVLNRYRTEVRNEIRNELRAELDQRLQPQQQQAANNINGANLDELLDEIHRNSLRTNVFTIKPPTVFHGQANEVFGDWIRQLEQFMVMQGIRAGDELHRKACLESYLGGAAKAILTDAARMANQNVTYDQAKGLLQQAYPDDRNRDLYQERLMECRQRRMETVPEYASKLRELARLAYPDLQLASRDQIIRPFFLRGLVMEIKDQVKFREFGSLEEAIKTASFVEAQLNRGDNENQYPKIASVHKPELSTESQLLASLIERMDRFLQIVPPQDAISRSELSPTTTSQKQRARNPWQESGHARYQQPGNGRNSCRRQADGGQRRRPSINWNHQSRAPQFEHLNEDQQWVPMTVQRPVSYPSRCDDMQHAQSSRFDYKFNRQWRTDPRRNYFEFRPHQPTSVREDQPSEYQFHQQSYRVPDTRDSIVCYNCQGYGHKAAQCSSGRTSVRHHRQDDKPLWSSEGPMVNCNQVRQHTESAGQRNCSFSAMNENWRSSSDARQNLDSDQQPPVSQKPSVGLVNLFSESNTMVSKVKQATVVQGQNIGDFQESSTRVKVPSDSNSINLHQPEVQVARQFNEQKYGTGSLTSQPPPVRLKETKFQSSGSTTKVPVSIAKNLAAAPLWKSEETRKITEVLCWTAVDHHEPKLELKTELPNCLNGNLSMLQGPYKSCRNTSRPNKVKWRKRLNHRHSGQCNRGRKGAFLGTKWQFLMCVLFLLFANFSQVTTACTNSSTAYTESVDLAGASASAEFGRAVPIRSSDPSGTWTLDKFKTSYENKSSHNVGYRFDLLPKFDKKLVNVNQANVTTLPAPAAGAQRTIYFNDTKPFHDRIVEPADPHLEPEADDDVGAASNEDVRS